MLASQEGINEIPIFIFLELLDLLGHLLLLMHGLYDLCLVYTELSLPLGSSDGSTRLKVPEK